MESKSAPILLVLALILVMTVTSTQSKRVHREPKNLHKINYNENVSPTGTRRGRAVDERFRHFFEEHPEIKKSFGGWFNPDLGSKKSDIVVGKSSKYLKSPPRSYESDNLVWEKSQDSVLPSNYPEFTPDARTKLLPTAQSEPNMRQTQGESSALMFYAKPPPEFYQADQSTQEVAAMFERQGKVDRRHERYTTPVPTSDRVIDTSYNVEPGMTRVKYPPPEKVATKPETKKVRDSPLRRSGAKTISAAINDLMAENPDQPYFVVKRTKEKSLTNKPMTLYSYGEHTPRSKTGRSTNSIYYSPQSKTQNDHKLRSPPNEDESVHYLDESRSYSPSKSVGPKRDHEDLFYRPETKAEMPTKLKSSDYTYESASYYKPERLRSSDYEPSGQPSLYYGPDSPVSISQQRSNGDDYDGQSSSHFAVTQSPYTSFKFGSRDYIDNRGQSSYHGSESRSYRSSKHLGSKSNHYDESTRANLPDARSQRVVSDNYQAQNSYYPTESRSHASKKPGSRLGQQLVEKLSKRTGESREVRRQDSNFGRKLVTKFSESSRQSPFARQLVNKLSHTPRESRLHKDSPLPVWSSRENNYASSRTSPMFYSTERPFQFDRKLSRSQNEYNPIHENSLSYTTLPKSDNLALLQYSPSMTPYVANGQAMRSLPTTVTRRVPLTTARPVVTQPSPTVPPQTYRPVALASPDGREVNSLEDLHQNQNHILKSLLHTLPLSVQPPPARRPVQKMPQPIVPSGSPHSLRKGLAAVEEMVKETLKLPQYQKPGQSFFYVGPILGGPGLPTTFEPPPSLNRQMHTPQPTIFHSMEEPYQSPSPTPSMISFGGQRRTFHPFTPAPVPPENSQFLRQRMYAPPSNEVGNEPSESPVLVFEHEGLYLKGNELHL